MEHGSAEGNVERLLALVAEVDPLIRSVNAVNDRALAEARELDRDTGQTRGRSPLRGRAVLVKDNIDTAGLASTAGSLALAGSPPAADAPLVRRLRAAGMVVLGKANLSEWANIRDPHSTSGWSAHGGLTRNPYGLNRTAWGSSSGSAAAVAARLAPLAVGTETDGSITMPAAACGVVGLKPTVGLVPTEGVVPISWSQDSPGPMALTVAEAAALLDVLAGSDTSASVGQDVRGLRVGVPRDLWGYSQAADAAVERSMSLLSAAGAEIVDAVALPALKEFDGEHELRLMLTELKVSLGRYLATRDGSIRTLEDVVSFNRAHAEQELPWFGQELLEKALETDGASGSAYLAAVEACRVAGIAELDRVLAEHDLAALVAPTTSPATPIDLVNGDSYAGGSSTQSALAGSPILSVPLELAHGLPVAVSLWGARHQEGTLVRLGSAVESGRDAATGPLPEPTFPAWV